MIPSGVCSIIKIDRDGCKYLHVTSNVTKIEEERRVEGERERLRREDER